MANNILEEIKQKIDGEFGCEFSTIKQAFVVITFSKDQGNISVRKIKELSNEVIRLHEGFTLAYYCSISDKSIEFFISYV